MWKRIHTAQGNKLASDVYNLMNRNIVDDNKVYYIELIYKIYLYHE